MATPDRSNFVAGLDKPGTMYASATTYLVTLVPDSADSESHTLPTFCPDRSHEKPCSMTLCKAVKLVIVYKADAKFSIVHAYGAEGEPSTRASRMSARRFGATPTSRDLLLACDEQWERSRQTQETRLEVSCRNLLALTAAVRG